MESEKDKFEKKLESIYFQKRTNFEKEQEINENRIKKQECLIEDLGSLNAQIKSLFRDLVSNSYDKDQNFIYYMEEAYSIEYQKVISQVDYEKERMLEEKRKLYNLEDELVKEYKEDLTKLVDM